MFAAATLWCLACSQQTRPVLLTLRAAANLKIEAKQIGSVSTAHTETVACAFVSCPSKAHGPAGVQDEVVPDVSHSGLGVTDLD